MAQVDFSNAVLDVNTDSNDLPFDYSYLYVNYNGAFYTYDSSQYHIVNSNYSVTKISETPSKVSFLYTGKFNSSGTFFYLGRCWYDYGVFKHLPWKVSNISFSADDTYSFVIDIEVSGNT